MWVWGILVVNIRGIRRSVSVGVGVVGVAGVSECVVSMWCH